MKKFEIVKTDNYKGYEAILCRPSGYSTVHKDESEARKRLAEEFEGKKFLEVSYAYGKKVYELEQAIKAGLYAFRENTTVNYYLENAMRTCYLAPVDEANKDLLLAALRAETGI